MYEILGVTVIAVTLILGRGSVANASASAAVLPSSVTATLADEAERAGDNNRLSDRDETGLWKLAGLLRLLGLAVPEGPTSNEVAPPMARNRAEPDGVTQTFSDASPVPNRPITNISEAGQ